MMKIHVLFFVLLFFNSCKEHSEKSLDYLIGFDHASTIFSLTQQVAIPNLNHHATGRVMTYFDEILLSGKGLQPIEKPRFKIVVLGSSTAAGTGPKHQDSTWVNQFRKSVQEGNSSDFVLNIAKGGYTTFHLLPTSTKNIHGRLVPDTLRNVSAALRHHADAVIINLPSNDTSIDIPIDSQLLNFKEMWDYFAKANIPVWITTTQPRNYPLQKRLVQKAVRDSLMARYGDFCINFWDDFAKADHTLKKEFDSGDGVHLNDRGHGLLVEKVLEKNIISVLVQNNRQ